MNSIVNVVQICSQWYDPMVETTVANAPLGKLRPSLGNINFLVLLHKLACVSREGKIVRKAIRKSVRVLSSTYKLPHFYSLKELVLYYEHHIYLRITQEYFTGSLKFAIKYCDENIVRYFLNYYRRIELLTDEEEEDEEGFMYEYRHGLMGAASIGNLLLVETLKKLAPEDCPQIYSEMDILEVMLRKASRDEKNPVISYCIDEGACMFDRALGAAAKYGNTFLMTFYYEKCVEDDLLIAWGNVLYSAARGGHKEAIRRALETSSNWRKGLEGAIASKKEGSLEWVNFFSEKLKEEGKYSINFVIETSAKYGRLDVIKTIVKNFSREDYNNCTNQYLSFSREILEYVLIEYEKTITWKYINKPQDIDILLYAFRCDKVIFENFLEDEFDSYWYENEAAITEFLEKLIQ